MAKKNNGKAAESGSNVASGTSPASGAPATPAPGPSICRNKHWQHLAAYDGAWLQMTPEHILSSATINHKGYCPRFVDNAVFFDLVRIRSLVGDAAELALRAAADTSGTGARLSPERRHRIRLEAVQKLAQAFETDEIAAGVAAMQSVATLEDLAARVLQRSPHDRHALYVHFFHEKLGSHQMVASARPDQLDRILDESPSAVPVLRTRAMAHLLRSDPDSAVADLNEALRLVRFVAASAQHRESAQHAVREKTREAEAASMAAAGMVLGRKKDRDRNKDENTTLSEATSSSAHQMLSSIEPQLLFRRATAYLTMACELVHEVLGPVKAKEGNQVRHDDPDHRRRVKAQKKLRVFAKRAVRDYLAFLGHLDYSPNLPIEFAENFTRRLVEASTSRHGVRSQDWARSNGVRRLSAYHALLQTHVTSRAGNGNGNGNGNGSRNGNDKDEALPALQIQAHPVRDLFTDPALAASLPPYPTQHRPEEEAPDDNDGGDNAPATISLIALMMAPLPARPPAYITLETVTYHPLLEDGLHALLLAYCLLDTPAPLMVQHANTVARLTRFADGYPVFQRAPSPARMDWSDVLRAADAPHWVGLPVTWDDYCRQFVLSPEKRREYDALAQQSAAGYPPHAGETIRAAVEFLSLGAASAAGTATAARVLHAVEAAEAAGAAEAALATQAAGKPVPAAAAKQKQRLRPPQAPRAPPPPAKMTERAAAIVRWLREGGPRKQQKKSDAEVTAATTKASSAAAEGEAEM